jgi:hypothetical protein
MVIDVTASDPQGYPGSAYLITPDDERREVDRVAPMLRQAVVKSRHATRGR